MANVETMCFTMNRYNIELEPLQRMYSFMPLYLVSQFSVFYFPVMSLGICIYHNSSPARGSETRVLFGDPSLVDGALFMCDSPEIVPRTSEVFFPHRRHYLSTHHSRSSSCILLSRNLYFASAEILSLQDFFLHK